jgi:hypothetical protein
LYTGRFGWTRNGRTQKKKRMLAFRDCKHVGEISSN